MSVSGKVVLGLDGGGTHTRIAVADLDGRVLSYLERKGASSLNKELRARENVREAIAEAVGNAGHEIADVAALAAGVAGFDSESDFTWVRELTEIEGLACPTLHVNDAVVAHRGAFLSKPGIMAISGTGSIIFCITEAGKHIRNYDFGHYAATAARFLSYDAVYKMIAGETDATDGELVAQALKHFGAEDLRELARMGSEGFEKDRRARDKLFGDFGPLVTEAALRGSRLAADICDQAVASITTGIRLLGSCFEADAVPVALIGGVANSAYIKHGLQVALSAQANRVYALVEPVLPAAFGAVIMALELTGIALNEPILNNLKRG